MLAAFPASAQVTPELRARMLAAAHTMQAASAVLLERKQQMGIWVGAEFDPNVTGLIGHEFTPMTTSPGTLANKRTPSNPDFAAGLVRSLSEFGLAAGDKVLVIMSGSFLAADLAALAALEALEADITYITSMGSSMWGANNAEFNLTDIVALLNARGIIRTRPLVTVLGGSSGVGRNMEPEARDALREAAAEHNVRLVEVAPLGDMVAQLRELIAEDTGGTRNIKLLVKVGGNVISTGGCKENYEFVIVSGFVPRPTLCTEGTPGLFHTMDLREDITVLHMLDMRKMTEILGVAYDPMPLPVPGEDAGLYGVE